MKRILGIVLILLGIALLVAGRSIAEQLAEGNERVSSAQQKVDTTNQVFGSNQVTKGFGQVFTGGAQNQINEGKAKIAQYENWPTYFHMGGIASIVLGAILAIFGARRKTER